jgi:sortase B
MFGALDKYLEEGYFNEHASGTLLVNGKRYPLQVFAVAECLSSDPQIFAPNEGYDTLGFIRENNLFFKEPASDHLIVFSTCKAPNSAERTIIAASILDPQNQ